MLLFNDGVSIPANGPLRVIQLSDGLYVIGEGMIIPVNDLAEANVVITEMKKEKK